MNLDNDPRFEGEEPEASPSIEKPAISAPNFDEPSTTAAALPSGDGAENEDVAWNRTEAPGLVPPAQDRSALSVPWPAGPISPPGPVIGREMEAHAPFRKADRPAGRVLVPMVSAFLGAVLALAAVAGLGGVDFSAEPATTTSTTIVADQASKALAPPSIGGTTLQLREANVDAVAVGEVVIPSIVSVQIGQNGPTGFSEVGSGSGVVFDPEGHIITNDHVASGGSAYQIVFADGRVYEATLVGTDPVTDLAVLKIDAANLVPIEFGTSDDLSVGDPAVAIGNPLGLEGGPSLTVGVLSAFDRQVQTTASDVLYGMLQTDAPITQGSSGGALVDETGRLIGITTAVGVSQIGVEGIGFATPVEIVERVVTELIANGRAGTAFLGIVGGTSFDATSDGARIPVGVEIASVDPAGAAAAAGLQTADLITSFEGQDVQTMQDLIVLLRRSHVGDNVELMIERSGSIESINVVLGEG